MKISISEIKAKMTEVLSKKGLSQDDIPFVINMYLGGQLRGHTSHGLASFAGFVNQDFLEAVEPEVLKATHSLFMIDAKGQSGNIVGKRAADEAIKRAKEEGVGMAVIKNMDSWLRPGAIAEYVADQDLIAIVVNSGGGTAIAPPGGYDPVIGTNPIAYGIPTTSDALVVDMATSKRAWGQVRLANKYGTDLPADTFYDDSGNVTLDPKKAWSVMPFGEYKGFSLAVLVGVLCGSLVDMPMMISSTAGNSFGQKQPERGGVIIVINPAQTTGLADFKKANSDFITKVKVTRPRKGETIRIPGEQAASEKSAKLSDDTIELPDELWKELKGL
jgi:L-2-hydroxycarboxylate dehydrogenase (NAD+)